MYSRAPDDLSGVIWTVEESEFSVERFYCVLVVRYAGSFAKVVVVVVGDDAGVDCRSRVAQVHVDDLRMASVDPKASRFVVVVAWFWFLLSVFLKHSGGHDRKPLYDL